jgi:hypothetical protein
MLRVPRPRIEFVRRSVPGKVSVGDSAEARLDPGLLAFLETPIGAGFHARYILPVGLANTAALAILGPATRDGLYWSGRDIEVEWLAAADSADSIIAGARLDDFSERLSQFHIEGRTGRGVSLYRGVVRLLAMREGRPAGFRTQGEWDAVRTRLAQARRAQPPASTQYVASFVAPESIPLGRTGVVELEIRNPGATSAAITVSAVPPFGAGLSIESERTLRATLDPGATAAVVFTIRADRPYEVNLSRPWPLVIMAGSDKLELPIVVPDPNPGRAFYILTEDCETFDGGPRTGDYPELGPLGNQNNFMDPEDYRTQMILKMERMNEIAERHGARFTHFYAITQRFAVDWATAQSRTGEWPRIAAEMDASVRRGSKLHEYCPHIHFDYEPDSPLPPQPRLLYDAATDGILPNQYWDPKTNPTHCYHDWDGSARGIDYIKHLGDWTDPSSKAGSLRKSIRALARLQANRRYPLIGRTGSHDFGKAPEDQAISTQAFLANGLRGNSDAYRHAAPPHPGGPLFWCMETDRQRPVADLRQTRLAQFSITMDTLFRSAEEMNEWFAAHWPSCQGPGVHALLFTTHAMFMRGEPDPCRSLEGGAFDQLDRHLAWVREHYPAVEFVTASEALIEFLDYYTPVLEAYVEPRLCGGDWNAGRCEFPVRLLGRGIRVDAETPATVRVAAPALFSPEDIAELRVLCGERVIACERTFDPRYQPVVIATLTDRCGPYRLEVRLRPERAAEALSCFDDAGFYEPPEPVEPDLFRCRPPQGSRIWPDVVRLLMNPVAGHAEPLGRRLHPLGAFAMGAALTAACSDGAPPVKMKLRWLREIALDEAFLAERDGEIVRIRNDHGAVVAEAEITHAPS